MSKSTILKSRVILNLVKARAITMMPEKKMRMRSTTVTRAPWPNLVTVAKAGVESAMSGGSKAVYWISVVCRLIVARLCRGS
jgi:hypothetical protein